MSIYNEEGNIGGSQIFIYLNEPLLFSLPTEQGHYAEQENILSD